MPEASDAAREEGRCISHRSAPDSERSHFTLIRGVFTCQGMMSYLLTLTPHTATLRYSSPTSLTRETPSHGRGGQWVRDVHASIICASPRRRHPVNSVNVPYPSLHNSRIRRFRSWPGNGLLREDMENMHKMSLRTKEQPSPVHLSPVHLSLTENLRGALH